MPHVRVRNAGGIGVDAEVVGSRAARGIPGLDQLLEPGLLLPCLSIAADGQLEHRPTGRIAARDARVAGTAGIRGARIRPADIRPAEIRVTEIENGEAGRTPAGRGWPAA